jgi:hypothetical protein
MVSFEYLVVNAVHKGDNRMMLIIMIIIIIIIIMR